jgi:uncharacterized protein (TIGR02611 family)
MEDAPRRRRLLDGVRDRRERHLERNRLVRFGIAAFGFIVVLVGLAMLVLPGPGLLVIAIGLGVLALEFAWAERLLERVIDQVERAADQVTKGSPVRRAALLVVGVLVVAASIAALFIWDIPFFPG